MNQVLTRRHRPRRSILGSLRRSRRGDTRAPIGRDFSDLRSPRSRRWWAAALGVSVLVSLAIVHVRVRLIEEGYLRAAAIERREVLLAKRQELKAETGTLRDRHRLKALAGERGFADPEKEFWLSQRATSRPLEPGTTVRRQTELRP